MPDQGTRFPCNCLSICHQSTLCLKVDHTTPFLSHWWALCHLNPFPVKRLPCGLTVGTTFGYVPLSLSREDIDFPHYPFVNPETGPTIPKKGAIPQLLFVNWSPIPLKYDILFHPDCHIAVCRTIAFVTSDQNNTSFLVHFEFQAVWRRSPFADSLWAGTFHLPARFKQTFRARFIDRS